MDSNGHHSAVPFVDLAAQYATLSPEIDEAITRVVRSSDFILGKEVTLFEEEFAAFCEVKHAVGIDSGTSALELALRAYGIGSGDEVITAANTFIATALAISYAGARPVLVDVNPGSYNLDPSLLESAITERTKAIMPVHLYGRPAEMEAIQEVARRHGLIVIEDACQAHGARYHGKRVGTMSDVAAFSFYPGKNLGAYGDGGMVVTKDDKVADSLRMLRNYGQRQKYYHLTMGFNRRLDSLQAAVLRVKLRHLDEWNEARRRHASLYTRLLEGVPVVTPEETSGVESVYHLYVIRAEDRDALAARLQDHGISTGIHYPLPIHLQPAYADLGYRAGDFPVTEGYSDKLLSLPMFAELEPSTVERVAEVIRDFVARQESGSFASGAAA